MGQNDSRVAAFGEIGNGLTLEVGKERFRCINGARAFGDLESDVGFVIDVWVGRCFADQCWVGSFRVGLVGAQSASSDSVCACCTVDELD